MEGRGGIVAILMHCTCMCMYYHRTENICSQKNERKKERSGEWNLHTPSVNIVACEGRRNRIITKAGKIQENHIRQEKANKKHNNNRKS